MLKNSIKKGLDWKKGIFLNIIRNNSPYLIKHLICFWAPRSIVTLFLTVAFCVNLKPATRHGILSIVFTLCDPLRFVASFLLSETEVLQEMCRHGIGWDPLLDVLQPEGPVFFINLELYLFHCYVPNYFARVIKRDVSTCGYSQCFYFSQLMKTYKWRRRHLLCAGHEKIKSCLNNIYN